MTQGEGTQSNLLCFGLNSKIQVDERFVERYSAQHLQGSHPLFKIFVELSDADRNGKLTTDLARQLEERVHAFGEEKKKESKQACEQMHNYSPGFTNGLSTL